MILTKKEFIKEFGYSSLRTLQRLIRMKKITLTQDGMINTDSDENREWCQLRHGKLLNKKTPTKKKSKKADSKNLKPETQLNLELDILSQKYEQAQKRNKLLDLKISKEQGSTISKEVLNRCIISIFDSMFKTLAEFPNVYAGEIIDIIRSNERPKEPLIEYLTRKIIAELNAGLDNAKKAAKKYYGG